MAFHGGNWIARFPLGQVRRIEARDHPMENASACGFNSGVIAEKGGTVAGSSPDNRRLPNRAGSEQVARKARSEMDRMPHARGMVLDAARMLSKRRGGPYRAIVMRVRNTLPHGRS